MFRTRILGCILIILLSGIKVTKCMQRFEQQPSYTEVNPGQDALLVCKIQSKRGTCSWQKDNKPVGMHLHKYEWAGSQETGECSIWIKSAKLEFDDGIWECQVTASNFHTQDALTSFPAKLVVRVPPQMPKIEFNTSQILPGQNLTVMQGEIATVKCISNYGNPPPVLKWLLDLDEIRSPRKQTNSTELDNPKTWMATSILELAITKESHGRLLKCVAYHESYPTKSATTEVRLNVMFVPETRLIGVPATDIEEFKDTVAIRCEVNANPRANVVWKKEGLSQPVSLQELLKFSPVTRQNSGLYTCHARNAAGEAPPLRFNLSIKYPPKILSVGPDRLTTSPLYTSATFECIAEGNPLPTYQWLQRLPTRPNYVREQGREAKLHISNVTYDHQGEYVCKAVNVIGGIEREVQSESVVLQVVGAPQILKFLLHNEIEIEKGETANISLIICSDPRPKFVAWEWGSLQLEAGSQIGKYKADELIQDLREDCYISVLHIQDADATDSRAYHLMAENDRGKDRHTVKLFVNEPFRINTILIFACGITTALLLLICVCLYTLRTENCCPAKKENFKENNLNGQRLDVENKSLRLEAIPSDAIYTAKRESSHDKVTVNPDTLKSSSTIFKHEDNPDNGNGEYVLERRSRLNGKLDSFPVISFDPQPVSYANDLKSQQQNQRETNDILLDNIIKKESKDSKKHSGYCKTMTVRPSRSQIRVNGIHNNKQDETQTRTSTLRSNSSVYN